MKQLLLLTFLLTIGCAAFAQTDSVYVWNKWCAKADSPMLFATGNNIIAIHSKTIKAADMTIKSMDNALKLGQPEVKNDTIYVMAMPYPKLGKKMRLMVADKHTQKALRTVNFTSEEQPQPLARLGNLPGPNALKKDIIAQSTLKVSFPNSLYSYPYYIKQFTFRARIAGKDVLVAVKGNKINNEITKALEIAPPGTFVEFTDIKASCLECSPRDLPNMSLWVK